MSSKKLAILITVTLLTGPLTDVIHAEVPKSANDKVSLKDRLVEHADNNRLLTEEAVEEVVGIEDPLGVTGIKLKNTKTDDKSDLDVDGLFIAIGHDPATKLFVGHLDMDDEGYIITASDSTATSVPGVFAAGDVQDKEFRQAVTAAGTGCMAALEAEQFIAENPVSAMAAE